MNDSGFSEDKIKFNKARDLFHKKKYAEATKILTEINNKEQNITRDEFERNVSDLLKLVKRAAGLRLSRRVLIGATFLTFFILSLLAFINKTPSLVQVKANTDRVIFGLVEDLNIGSLPARAVDISSPDDILLDVERIEMPTEYDEKTDEPLGWKKINLATDTAWLRGIDPNWSITIKSSYLRIAGLEIGGGYSLVLETSGESLKITNNSEKAEGYLDLPDEIILACNAGILEAGGEKIDIDGIPLKIKLKSEQISFKKSKNLPLMISFKPESPTKAGEGFLLTKHIPVDSLVFKKRYGLNVESSIRAPSSVCIVENNNKTLNLDAGESLLLAGLDDFRIRSVFVKNGLMKIDAQGNVDCLRTGTFPFLKNRIPSILEWLAANELFMLFIGALLPVISMLVAVFYRLKVVDEN